MVMEAREGGDKFSLWSRPGPVILPRTTAENCKSWQYWISFFQRSKTQLAPCRTKLASMLTCTSQGIKQCFGVNSIIICIYFRNVLWAWYLLCSFQEVQRLQQDPVCQGPRFHPGQAFKLLSLLIKFLLKNCACRSFTFVLQINLASVDESTGRMTGGFTTYAICGAIRRWGFLKSRITTAISPFIWCVFKCPYKGHFPSVSDLFCRRMGESDDCINRLAKKDGIIDKKF